MQSSPLHPHPLPATLHPYLPPPPSQSTSAAKQPFLTLTYAASLDSRLSLLPKTPTAISGPLSKSTTHHLRSHHAAILVGVGAANADDPGLNCRHVDTPLERQPRPVILDPAWRWQGGEGCRVVEAARKGEGLAPYVFVKKEVAGDDPRRRVLEQVGGMVVVMGDGDPGLGFRWSWSFILDTLRSLGLTSVMVEGGGVVINDLLAPENLPLIDSVIITIAPIYLGQYGAGVEPGTSMGDDGRDLPAVEFKDVEWCILGRDVVMVARPITHYQV